MASSSRDPTKASKKIPAKKRREHHKQAAAVHPVNSPWTSWTPSALRPAKISRAHPRPVTIVPPRGIGPVREPNETDVLCGRGAIINLHKGNIDYRETVSKYKKMYLSASTKKMDKAFIAAEIVQQIRNSYPPGRFLKKERDGWYDIGDAQAIKKVGQQLREDAPKIREELDNEDGSGNSDGDVPVLQDTKARCRKSPGEDVAGTKENTTQRKIQKIALPNPRTPSVSSSTKPWLGRNQGHPGTREPNMSPYLGSIPPNLAMHQQRPPGSESAADPAMFYQHHAQPPMIPAFVPAGSFFPSMISESPSANPSCTPAIPVWIPATHIFTHAKDTATGGMELVSLTQTNNQSGYQATAVNRQPKKGVVPKSSSPPPKGSEREHIVLPETKSSVEDTREPPIDSVLSADSASSHRQRPVEVQQQSQHGFGQPSGTDLNLLSHEKAQEASSLARWKITDASYMHDDSTLQAAAATLEAVRRTKVPPTIHDASGEQASKGDSQQQNKVGETADEIKQNKKNAPL